MWQFGFLQRHRHGEQVLDRNWPGQSVGYKIAQVDLEFGRQLKEELSAGPAGANASGRDDEDRLPVAGALRDGLGAGGSFGAKRDRVRSVFDVATFECTTLVIDQHATDVEVAVGAIGSLGHLASLVHISHGMGMVDRIHGASPRRSR